MSRDQASRSRRHESSSPSPLHFHRPWRWWWNRFGGTRRGWQTCCTSHVGEGGTLGDKPPCGVSAQVRHSHPKCEDVTCVRLLHVHRWWLRKSSELHWGIVNPLGAVLGCARCWLKHLDQRAVAWFGGTNLVGWGHADVEGWPMDQALAAKMLLTGLAAKEEEGP
jgi:hypothetical protein